MKEKLVMKKYLVAAVLIGAFATPALADEVFVMLEMTTKKCVTMVPSMPTSGTRNTQAFGLFAC
jgi:hypothetical protein